MKLFSFFTFLLIFILALSYTNAQQIKIGTTAPPISIRELVKGEIDKSNPFQGKTVVLEFWATWCAPCVAFIPHLNQLAEKYANKDVIFVSITSEERSVVEKFLAKNVIKSTIVLDKIGSQGIGATQLAYGVTGIPETFIIDKQGQVSWYGHPSELSDEMLHEYFNNGNIVVNERSNNNNNPFSSVSNNSFYTLIVNRSQTANFMKDGLLMGSFIYRQNEDTTEIIYRGGSVVDFISKFFGQPTTRIKVTGFAPIEPFDLLFRVTVPTSDSALNSKVVSAIENVFEMDMGYEYETTKGWSMILTSPEKLTPSASSKGSSYFPTDSTWIGAGVPISVFSFGLESNLKQCFFDETNIVGKFDFNVPTKSIDELRFILNQQYGIDLQENMRPIQIIRLTFH